jgi:hypothetical protein
MATITVTITDNQVIGAKDHFGTQNNTEAVALFNEWLDNHLDQWYADYLQKDIDAISAALIADPTQMLAVMQLLGLV